MVVGATLIGPGELVGGRFLIEGVVASGSFSVVYRAVDVRDGCGAVVKQFRVAGGTGVSAAEGEEWFGREARVLAGLDSMGLPRLLCGPQRDVRFGLWFAMELIEGETVACLVGRGVVGAAVAAHLVRDVAVALGHVHRRGWVHRDVKSSNVVMDRRGRAWLVDFGIAVAAGGADLAAVGTWGWTPVEQIRGKAEPRSDIYAAGLLLHCLVSGDDPEARFGRLQAGGASVEEALRGMAPSVGDAAVDAVIGRASAYAAEDRFGSAEEMVRALNVLAARVPAVLGGGGAAVRGSGHGGRLSVWSVGMGTAGGCAVVAAVGLGSLLVRLDARGWLVVGAGLGWLGVRAWRMTTGRLGAVGWVVECVVLGLCLWLALGLL